MWKVIFFFFKVIEYSVYVFSFKKRFKNKTQNRAENRITEIDKHDVYSGFNIKTMWGEFQG